MQYSGTGLGRSEFLTNVPAKWRSMHAELSRSQYYVSYCVVITFVVGIAVCLVDGPLYERSQICD